MTLIEFGKPDCGRCTVMDPEFRQLALSSPEVFLRKINIVTFDSPIAERYDILSTPIMWVYNAKGELIGSPGRDIPALRENIAVALISSKN